MYGAIAIKTIVANNEVGSTVPDSMLTKLESVNVLAHSAQQVDISGTFGGQQTLPLA